MCGNRGGVGLLRYFSENSVLNSVINVALRAVQNIKSHVDVGHVYSHNFKEPGSCIFSCSEYHMPSYWSPVETRTNQLTFGKNHKMIETRVES